MADGMLKTVLARIIKQEQGILLAMILDRSGVPIEYIQKFKKEKIDKDGISSMASAVYGVVKEEGKSLDLGKPFIISSELEKGKIFLTPCQNEKIMCIVTKDHVNIGMIRQILRENIDQINSILEKEHGEMVQAPKDIMEEDIEESEIDEAIKKLEHL